MGRGIGKALRAGRKGTVDTFLGVAAGVAAIPAERG